MSSRHRQANVQNFYGRVSSTKPLLVGLLVGRVTEMLSDVDNLNLYIIKFLILNINFTNNILS